MLLMWVGIEASVPMPAGPWNQRFLNIKDSHSGSRAPECSVYCLVLCAENFGSGVWKSSVEDLEFSALMI